MAELKRTYIKGNLNLKQIKYKTKDDSNKEVEKTVNPSFRIGVVPKDKNDASVKNHNANHWDDVRTKGTGLVERCRDVASKVLGRNYKLNLNFYSGGYLYVVDTKRRSPWVMTKDKNGKYNFSVKMIGDSLRIYGKMQYKPQSDDPATLNDNFSNKILVRVKLANKDHLIKQIGKASGTCAGYGPACAVYITDATEKRAKIRTGYWSGTGAKKKWVWNAPKSNKIYAPKDENGDFYTTIRPVREKNPQNLDPPEVGKEWPIWFDIVLSASVTEISKSDTLSFYIECPVRLNNVYTDFGG